VERQLGLGRIVPAVRHAHRRQVRGVQTGEDVAGELAVDLVLAHAGGDDDGEVPVDVHGVRRDDDSRVAGGSLEAAAGLLHRRHQLRSRVDVAVRCDRRERDHGSVEMRSTSSSRKRPAATSTPARQLTGRSVTSHRSTTVRPSQNCELVSTSTLHSIVVTSDGSITSATASASWSGEPSKPYRDSWKRWKKSESSATAFPARPEPRNSSACSRLKSALCVTSSPIMVTSMPLSNTAAAASGSTNALNSAAGVVLPSAIAPPIQTMRSSRSRTSGCRSNSIATLVSGPVGTSTTPGSSSSARKSAAWASTGV